MFRHMKFVMGWPMPGDKLKRSKKTGRFEEWSPLANPLFLQGVRIYVKATDVLLPMLQSMADAVELNSSEWHRLRLTASMLRDMSSNMASELVRQGERLILPPPTTFTTFNWGDPDDAEVLGECVRWHAAARDVQWFFKEMGVAGKPSTKQLKAVRDGDQDAAFATMAHMVCGVMDDLKDLLVDRLSKAQDGWYLNEVKKTALRLPMFGQSVSDGPQ